MFAMCLGGVSGWIASGCASPPDPLRGVRAAESRVERRSDRPVGGLPQAMVGGRSVSTDDLGPALLELAGRQAVEELALDRALGQELDTKNLRITDEDLGIERRLLEEELAARGVGEGAETVGLVERVRRSRGLGPSRYAALLRRNAGLRRLVRDEVSVEPEEVTAERAVRFGEKVRARVIVVESEQKAAAIRSRVMPSTDGLAGRFAAEAFEHSTDASAGSGGLVRAFSSADPEVPRVIRSAVSAMREGELSPVLAVDNGFAVVLVEGRIPAEAPASDDTLEASVRRRKEREAMEALARRLMESQPVTVFDESLRWGWGR